MFPFFCAKTGKFLKYAIVLVSLVAMLGWFTAQNPVLARPLQQIGCGPIVQKSGSITIGEPWTSDNIYYITANLTVNAGVTLTIDPGTTIKVNDDVSLDVLGTLVSNGTPGAEVIFTSVHDDSDGCDIQGDGNNILPQRGDWGAIKIHNTNNGTPVSGLIVRYANEGLAAWQDLASDVAPTISGNTFANNTYGLTLVINNSGNSIAVIENNVFTDNAYGFYVHRDTNDTGTAKPSLTDNQFVSNTILPIFLGHSAYPTYSGNTFQGYPNPDQRLGIGLGGTFTSSGTLPIINSASDGSGLDMPYVVQHTNWTIADGVTVSVGDGTIIKVEYRSDMSGSARATPYRSISVNGVLANSGNIIITSIRDDSVGGDTNGDGVATEPLSDDWERVYFPEDQITLSNIEFRYAKTAVYVEDTNTGGYAHLTPLISNCLFNHNQIAVYLKAADNIGSRIDAALTGNTFEFNTSFLIFQANTAFAVFDNNTFSQNLKPAIALTGNIYSSGFWNVVPGNELPSLPYIIYGTTTIKGFASSPVVNPQAEVTVAPDLVFKFYDTAPSDTNVDPNLYVDGDILLQSSAGHEIVFTSYNDDSVGGDTNGNGSATAPARGNWDSIRLKNSATIFHDAIVMYGDRGLVVENTTSVPLSPEITANTFQHNINGVYLTFQSSGEISSLISDNIFDDNEYGLRTYAKPAARGIASPNIANNTFAHHTGFPLYYDGATNPTYGTNVFAENVHPAIAITGYWGADATLTSVPGDSNAPLLGDSFPYVVPDLNTATNVDENVKVELTEVLTIPAGSVIKLANDTFFDVYGKLNLESTSISNIIFTSYKDDSVKGDTNADGGLQAPAISNWRCIYLRSDDGSTSFHDTIVRYSQFGLRIQQDIAANLAPQIFNNLFKYNFAGLTLGFKSNFDITSQIFNNQFIENTYGLLTTADVATTLRAGSANVTLDHNHFQGNTGFPIFLYHSADINYVKNGGIDTNTFAENTHPAIAVNGYWPRDVTWSRVIGDNGQPFPYVVFKDTRVQPSWQNDYLVQGVYYMGSGFNPPQITIPAGTVVKFDMNLGIYAWGKLNLLSDTGNPIYFTSYKDDAAGGDTNGDGTASTPGLTDWKSVWLCDYPSKPNDIHHVIGRYGVAPIAVYYDGPEATSISPTIRDSTFEQNLSALLIAVGYYNKNNDATPEGPGAGDIYAVLTNLMIRNNDYGLLTFAHTKSTGIVRPILTNVTFLNIDEYPVFLGGTTQLDFTESVFAGGPASLTPLEPLETPISMGIEEHPALPTEAYKMPENSPALEASNVNGRTDSGVRLQALDLGQFSPAIAWGGAWNNAVTMPILPGVPFAVAGNYPVTLVINGISSKPSDDVIIGATNPTGSSVTFSQSGSVVKFNNNCLGNANKKCKLVVYGDLVLLGTESKPIIFTSIHDDSVGGDTNGNGSVTTPTKGQWDFIQLSGPSIDFKYTIVRYAVEGVRVFFKGSDAQNIDPTIQHSNFNNNKTGIVLWVAGAGDLGKRPEPEVDPDGERLQIFHNTFINNDNHIVVHRNESDTGTSPKPLVAGIVYTDIAQNDLLETTDFGVDNNMEIPLSFAHPEYYTVLAKNNYWSDPSGPYHSILNPLGKGVNVSDLVDFDPFATTLFHQGMTYTINGRVVWENDPGTGLTGVTIHLGGDMDKTATTDLNGYFQITGLPFGTYYLIPDKPGNYFTPPIWGPFELQSDTEVKFYANQVTLSERYLFFDQTFVQTVQKLNGDVTVKLRVRLNKLPNYPTSFKFSTSSGSATSINCASNNRETCDYIERLNVTDTITAISTCAISPTVPIPYCKEISFTIKPGDPTEPIESFQVILTSIVDNQDHPTILPGSDVAVILINPKYDFSVFLPFIRK